MAETPDEKLRRIGFLCGKSVKEIEEERKQELLRDFEKAGGYKDMPPPKNPKIYPIELLEYCQTKKSTILDRNFTGEECCEIIGHMCKTLAYFQKYMVEK